MVVWNPGNTGPAAGILKVNGGDTSSLGFVCVEPSFAYDSAVIKKDEEVWGRCFTMKVVK